MSTPVVIDVDESTFQTEVIERSREVPVVVDFWAEWCGPCRTLGPILEEQVAARHGEVVLAKVDTDANPGLSRSFRIQGIPAVKAFRDGRVVDEFTGALPPGHVSAFLDRIVPTPADRAASRGRALAGHDPESARIAFQEALDLDAGHRDAALGLAELLTESDPDRARELVIPHRPDPAAESLLARLDVAEHGGGNEAELRARVEADPEDAAAQLELGRVLAASGNYDEAAEALLAAVRHGGDLRDEAREQLVSLFNILGPDDPVVRATRPRLASALY